MLLQLDFLLRKMFLTDPTAALPLVRYQTIVLIATVPIEWPTPLPGDCQNSNTIRFDRVEDAVRKSPQNLTSNVLDNNW
jgi:hypothetical protein